MEKWCNLAIEEAKTAYKLGEVPVGAVLVKDDELIAKAHNLVEKKKDASAHAEMLCLKQACSCLSDWRLNDCILVTSLEPCVMCAGSLILHRIKKIIYLAKDFRHGAHGSFIDVFAQKHPIHQIEIFYNDSFPEAGCLLKDFFNERRKENEKRNYRATHTDGGATTNSTA